MITEQFRDRALGAFIGLAIGDALGAPLEFSQRDSLPPVTGYRAGGPFNLRAGEWTDDTACALALAHSILDTGGKVGRLSTLKHLLMWYRAGVYSSNGRCFDIGGQTRKALHAFEATGVPPYPDDDALGNGGIMRLAPVLLAARDCDECSVMGGVQASATHPSAIGSMYAMQLGAVLWQEAHNYPVNDPRLNRRKRSTVKSSGHVQATFEAAQWCVGNTNNFRSAVLFAANLGDDSDTVAAVTGQWAGARYGLSGIPQELKDGLLDYAMLVDVAERLLDLPR